MTITVRSGTLHGVEGLPVEVEVDLLRRLPAVTIVGLASSAVREAAERVRSAINQTELEFPRKRVVVNLAPADVRKEGTGFDLPIAVGILAAAEQVDASCLKDTAFAGELSLGGELRGIRGALPLTLMARELGLPRIVLPAENGPEAASVEGVEVLVARDLQEVIDWMDGRGTLPLAKEPPPTAMALGPDLREVRGQHRARRALEIAAAGGHNLLMIGPPGCGKTMLAARLPSILPDLAFEEALDLTRVHSVAGLIEPGEGILQRRPFRAPHHTVSAAGMIGSASLRPGEISLAHHGVLFLDEVPEFRRDVLELLRAPLEDGKVTISRAVGSVTYPAAFSMVAAANPCPCGFAGHPARACICQPGLMERYRAKLSGPLLDRVDLQVWVQPVDPELLVRGKPGEASSEVRARVIAARDRQRARYGPNGPPNNALLRGDAIRDAADPSPAANEILHQTLDTHALSARAWSRILKVSRTIADLDGAPRVEADHVLEATAFRVGFAEEAA